MSIWNDDKDIHMQILKRIQYVDWKKIVSGRRQKWWFKYNKCIKLGYKGNSCKLNE